MIQTCLIDVPIGGIRASAENDAITGLWFAGQKYYPDNMDTWIDNPDYHVFELLRTWLRDYFAYRNPKPSIKLNPDGTDFRKSVWDVLLKIPYGQVVTYGEVAKMLGMPSDKYGRAIGGAVGHNPISILIPCHRVIGSSGGITGYAGGVDKKRALLEIEQSLIE